MIKGRPKRIFQGTAVLIDIYDYYIETRHYIMVNANHSVSYTAHAQFCTHTDFVDGFGVYDDKK